MRRLLATTFLALVAATPPDPNCSTGLLDADGTNCCAASCGKCGGSGCSGDCCSGTVQAAARSCASHAPPCVMDPTRELACELNGELLGDDATCACRAGWAGSTCGVFDFLPAAADGGMNEPGSSSWGFSTPGPMPQPDGRYYAVVAFELDHAGIDAYGSHMGLAMTAADRAAGPYKRLVAPANATLFAPVFSDNPGAAYDPSTGLFLTYHQGCGTQPAADSSCAHGSPVLVMTAPSAAGPWTERGPVFNGSSGPYPQWDEWASNAAPCVLANGTTFLMYRSHGYTATTGEKFGEFLGLARAPAWDGPFEKVQADPIVKESNEDPFMWRDAATGHFHAITHLEAKAAAANGGSVGGRHAYSRDARVWYADPPLAWILRI